MWVPQRGRRGASLEDREDARPLWHKDDCIIVGVNGVLHGNAKHVDLLRLLGLI